MANAVADGAAALPFDRDARPRGARRRHAGDGRAGGVPADPPHLGRADPVPVGARRGDRPYPRPRNGRRRLCDKAVQPARAGRPRQRHPAARAVARRRRPSRPQPRRGSASTRARPRRFGDSRSASPRSSSPCSGAAGSSRRMCSARADCAPAMPATSTSPIAPSTATSATSAPSSPRPAPPRRSRPCTASASAGLRAR